MYPSSRAASRGQRRDAGCLRELEVLTGPVCLPLVPRDELRQRTGPDMRPATQGSYASFDRECGHGDAPCEKGADGGRPGRADDADAGVGDVVPIRPGTRAVGDLEVGGGHQAAISHLRGRPRGRLRGTTTPAMKSSPPQTPQGSRRSSAPARHSCRTGQAWQRDLANSTSAGASANQSSGSLTRQGPSAATGSSTSSTSASSSAMSCTGSTSSVLGGGAATAVLAGLPPGARRQLA